MSAPLKRAAAHRTRPIYPSRRSAADPGGTSLRLSSAVTQAQSALRDCIGALCAIEVTLHSLKWQDVAPAEQEVLRRALQAVSYVQEWLAESTLRDLLKNAGRGDSNGTR